MKYLLDTNVCIGYLKGNAKIIKNFKRLKPAQILLCSVVKSELYYGSIKSQKQAKNLAVQKAFIDMFGSYDFDDKAAMRFGEIRADLESKGTPIGAYDFQIAAIALANNLTLVTHNTKEFSRVVGLPLTDWEI